ncbi:MAG: F0F1 ATP synthase subunit epsilon, partial [Flavobacteriales bacterium]|nr:F0F1 ATP synthase subunit epsilon [Flavobacteriales bacterium]
DGSFGLLNNHAALVSTLKKGEIKIIANGNEQTFPVNGGVVEVNNNKVIVLAE